MPFDTPIHTNAQSIDRVLNAGLPVVLVFWRNNCAPCQTLSPRLETLARRYAGKLLFAKVDADSETALVRRFDITRLPEILFIKKGQTVAKATGAISEEALQRWCDHLVSGGPRPALPTGPSEPLRPTATPGATAPGRPSRPTPSPSRPAPAPAGDGKPIHLTEANFDQIINGDLPVLVDFWAPWCGPCHMVAPTVEALAREFAGKLVVGKLNVDENQSIAARYGIMSIPSLLIFRNGRVVDQVVGALPEHMLRQRVFPHVR